VNPQNGPTTRTDPLGAPWPGLIPLRPLAIGDLFGGAIRLVRNRAAVLVPVALLGALIASAAEVGLMLSFPAGQRTLPADWIDQVMAGSMTIPPGVLWPTVLGTLLDSFTGIVVTGLAAAFAASDALDQTQPAKVALERLRGRWPALLAVALITTVAMVGGLFLFVVPGAIALAVLSFATAVVPVERAGIGRALSRSVELSRGFRLRILGIALLTLLLGGLIGMVAVAILPADGTMTTLLLTLLMGAVVSAVITPWTSSVLALLYIDTRIRKENLAFSLIRATMRP
jgi:hypothetical protein